MNVIFEPVSYLAPRGLARARPLPRVPRPVPRFVPPLLPVPAVGPPPRLSSPDLGRDVALGVVYFDEAREEVGRFDIYDVSAVLLSIILSVINDMRNEKSFANIKVVSPS